MNNTNQQANHFAKPQQPQNSQFGGQPQQEKESKAIGYINPKVIVIKDGEEVHKSLGRFGIVLEKGNPFHEKLNAYLKAGNEIKLAYTYNEANVDDSDSFDFA